MRYYLNAGKIFKFILCDKSVCLFPINVKMAEPILSGNFFTFIIFENAPIRTEKSV